jgi:MoaA/NifB/PqqE/SkfB family radical SAM enzyme
MKDLRRIHVELTNSCNAACPMCARFYLNTPITRPDLELGQITLDQFKKFFPPDILKQLTRFQFCGTQGDPGMARDLYEICEYVYLHKNDQLVIQMHTNGGMRKPDWWAQFGKLFSYNKSPHPWRVIFSIDGLEDTNHLYRRNVNWDKLMSNAQAFIDAGGIAIWEFLIFKHNEHQVEEAEALAKKMGFRMFVPKAALGVDNDNYLQPLAARNREGEIEYVIEAPTKVEYRNLQNPIGEKPVETMKFNLERAREDDYDKKVDNAYTIVDKVKDANQLNSCSVKCRMERAPNSLEIFVDNFGRVIPCCYMGTHINARYNDFASLQAIKHMKDYGWDNFDLNKHSLREIIEANHLDRVFADSWDKPTIKDGKMAYCAQLCGQKGMIDRIYSVNK